MRVAVLTDVHSNITALEAVLADIHARGINTIWCLGDTTGYASHPVECLELVKNNCEFVLRGNHDAPPQDQIPRFLGDGMLGIQHSYDELNKTPSLLKWLEERPRYTRLSNGIELVHGSPADPTWHYLLRPDDFDLAYFYAGDNSHLILCGHTHYPTFVQEQQLGEWTGGNPKDGESHEIDLSKRQIINPGSCGQPRDHGGKWKAADARACWVELDGNIATWHRTEYDYKKAAQLVYDLHPKLAYRSGWRLYPLAEPAPHETFS